MGIDGLKLYWQSSATSWLSILTGTCLHYDENLRLCYSFD